MKAKLEFDLPEEQQEFLTAAHAMDLSIVIFDMDQYLRGRLKHEELDEKEYEALDKARDKLWEIINERDVSTVTMG